MFCYVHYESSSSMLKNMIQIITVTVKYLQQADFNSCTDHHPPMSGKYIDFIINLKSVYYEQKQMINKVCWTNCKKHQLHA